MKGQSSGRISRRLFGRAAGSVLLALALTVSLAAYCLRGQDEPASLPAGTLRVHVIDVGNADAALLSCDGQYMLIDAGEGGSGDRVVSYLRRQGVQRLDYVIATHPDADHIGGMAAVVKSFSIGTFIMPQVPAKLTRSYENLLQALLDKGVEAAEPEAGREFMLGAALVKILGPAGTFGDANDLSVVCMVTNGSHRFLFMGDAEKAAETALLASGQPLKADFLKVGHHGSRTSSSAAFLDAVSPRYAAIPCGADNGYGHPHQDVLDALRERGVTVFRSDTAGTVVVDSNGSAALSIATEK